ncbi:MAG: bifunctional pyr operon transcriptional regulator/uracil phosphoribosyltransferase PyrR [Gracilibacteraceae bacterium]|jgi:pyrimidine operon attenuation protein/uracil phosphoribosyltransferase|nr:bifunctional pyr operon transcriptional regulator/uracil phosphoribosyltransferase PyrR [Gracilibacteraceae bacterium]
MDAGATKKQILSEDDIQRAIARITHEILERNAGVEDLVLVGIQRRGVPLAGRIRAKVAEIEGIHVPMGVLDITYYRDDLSTISGNTLPVVHETAVRFPIDGKVVVLVDDVLYTGRTIRAALDALMDIGRPKKIQLAALVDRGLRELPIQADFVGKDLPTSCRETVSVCLREIDNKDEVVLSMGQQRQARNQPIDT